MCVLLSSGSVYTALHLQTANEEWFMALLIGFVFCMCVSCPCLVMLTLTGTQNRTRRMVYGIGGRDCVSADS